jgi:hypothetical protein
MSKLVSTLLLVLVAGCALSAELIRGQPSDSAVAVSMIELIGNGDRLDEWPVAVVGVFSYDGEWALLYADSERFKIRDSSSSLQLNPAELRKRLSLTERELIALSGQYVEVQGTFLHTPRTRRSVTEVVIGPAYAGEIHTVNLIATSQVRDK